MQCIAKATSFQDLLYPYGHAYSDKEIYQVLFDAMKKEHQKGSPFLLVCYSLGTHHGFDSPDKKYGDVKNPYLNKFYNLDHWIGEFYHKFKKSKLAEDTLLVITSDHATFPAKPYINTFHSKQRYFTGEIPLFFYMKGIAVKKIDAKWRNSLALAPTICDILRIEKQHNAFLGNSLFINQPTQWECYYGEASLMLKCKNGIFYPVAEDESCKQLEQLVDAFMRIGK